MSAGKTVKVMTTSAEIEMVNNSPTDAAPLCGLKDSDTNVPIVVNALITTAREVLDAYASATEFECV